MTRREAELTNAAGTRRPAERVAWVIGGVGLVGTSFGWAIAPASFPHAWLAALVAWLGWPLGSLGLLLIHALTGGRWGYALRAQFAAGVNSLPLLLVAIVPWLLVLPSLYPWARPGVSAHLANGFYLSVPFFVARVALYLIVWFGLSLQVLRALREAEPGTVLARLAPGGLILLAVTITFASIDMTMSLDPEFVSSVYGLMAMAGMGLLALSVAVLAATLGMRSPPLSAGPGRVPLDGNLPLHGDTLPVLGKLLMALVLLWAYLDFMQFLIVWQSNLAGEAPWYLIRSAGIWGVVATLVAVGHFALPMFALLWSPVRRSSRGIATVAALLVLSEVIRAWWLVLPASNSGLRLIDVMAMMGMLGVGAALALRSPWSALLRIGEATA